MERFRKILAISTIFVTVLSMSVVTVPNAGAVASAGDLIKTTASSAVYYIGADSKRYVFPTEQTYFSWYKDFSGVITVSQAEFENYAPGANVTMRPGTKLVQEVSMETPWKVLSSKVYAVEPGGKKVQIPDAATATTLYGANWESKIQGVPSAFFTSYSESGKTATATAYPAGSLISKDSVTYYIDADGKARKVTDAGMTANRFNASNVVAATISLPTTGADITSAETGITETSSGAGGTIGAGTGLTVALSANTAASATTLVEDTDADGAQALIPVTSINLTAAADGAVKVKTLKFKRAGVPSADADFAEFYLYDGDTLLAKYSSITSGVLTFNNASGLVTVAAGTTKTVTLKVNLAIATTPSKAYNFAVLAATDVVTDGAAVSGTFPITGNTMTTASVADLGKLTLAQSADSSAPDPGTLGHTLWQFTAAAADQDIEISKMTLTVIGTVSVGDLANFSLEVGGVQIGSKVAAMDASKQVAITFDTPYKITKGTTKTVILKGDVVSGTARTYRIYFDNKEDVVAKDSNYGVLITPNQADSWTDINSSADTTINSGALTVSRSTASPTGNIASGATNVEVARFDFKATGEPIKIDTIYLYSTASLYQTKLYVDDSQVGTAVNLATTTASTVSLGNNFIIPAGATKQLVVKADIKDSSGSVNKTSGIAVTVSLSNLTSGGLYTKQTSGSSSNAIGITNGNSLTVKTGTLNAVINSAFGNRSTSLPTGVVNAVGVKVASFVLTAGSGEGVTITQISLYDPATTNMATDFQNLTLKNGTTVLGNVISNLNSTAGNYNYSPSPAIKLAAGQQYVVDAYADIKGSASDAGGAAFAGIKFASITATGDTTAADASYNPTDFALQNICIASAGTLNMSDDADTPVAQQIVMGATDQEVARFKLEAGASEAVTITGLTLSDSVSSAATGTLTNIKVYDASNNALIAGPVQLDTTNASTTYAHAIFTNLNLTIAANGSKILIVKADVTNAAEGATGGSTHTFALLTTNGTGTETIVAKGAQSGVVLTTSGGSLKHYSSSDTAASADQSGSAMTVYRTKVSAAWASDTPTGAGVGSATQTIAKINITNTANVGNHTAKIKYVNLALSTANISNTATRTLTVYKDSTSTTALGTTSWAASENRNFSASEFTDAGLTDVEIASGATKLFIFTLDTSDAGTTDSMSVNMAASDIGWDDSAGTTITTVNSLPLQTKTLTY